MTDGQRLAARILLPFLAAGIMSRDWFTFIAAAVLGLWVYFAWTSETPYEDEADVEQPEGET